MAESSNRISQIHVRVPTDFKTALKMFYAREGRTEQAWISNLVETWDGLKDMPGLIHHEALRKGRIAYEA
jgi:hypothetical protein